MTQKPITDPLLEKLVQIPKDVIFVLFVLNTAINLRKEVPGATITNIYSINTQVIGKIVSVLSSPLAKTALNRLLVKFDPQKKMEINELVFVYYDALAVKNTDD